MAKSKIEVVFVLPSLAAGGAERVISLVAKSIDKKTFNSTLVVVGYKKDNVYDVEGVNVIYLNEPRVRDGVFKLYKYIKKSKPDVIVSCMGHLNTTMALILLFFPKIKLINRETNIKKLSINQQLPKHSFRRKILNKITINKTDAVISQSKDMAEELITDFNVPKSKIVIINNPISEAFKFSKATQKTKIKTYITVGRLKKIKGHTRILNVLSKLKIPFRYVIIGDGDYKDSIKNHVSALNLESQVEFITHTNEVPKYLNESDVFLQGSYTEGFPNALLESCAIGTPVIAFQALGGTKEIVEHGVNGYLANDEAEYLKYLQQLNNEPLDAEIVSKSVFAKFDKAHIIGQYEQLIQNVVLK